MFKGTKSSAKSSRSVVTSAAVRGGEGEEEESNDQAADKRWPASTTARWASVDSRSVADNQRQQQGKSSQKVE